MTPIPTMSRHVRHRDVDDDTGAYVAARDPGRGAGKRSATSWALGTMAATALAQTTEAHNTEGTQFGMKRFSSRLEGLHAERAAPIGESISAKTQVCSPIRLDDQTLVVLRRVSARR